MNPMLIAGGSAVVIGVAGYMWVNQEEGPTIKPGGLVDTFDKVGEKAVKVIGKKGGALDQATHIGPINQKTCKVKLAGGAGSTAAKVGQIGAELALAPWALAVQAGRTIHDKKKCRKTNAAKKVVTKQIHQTTAYFKEQERRLRAGKAAQTVDAFKAKQRHDVDTLVKHETKAMKEAVKKDMERRELAKINAAAEKAQRQQAIILAAAAKRKQAELSKIKAQGAINLAQAKIRAAQAKAKEAAELAKLEATNKAMLAQQKKLLDDRKHAAEQAKLAAKAKIEMTGTSAMLAQQRMLAQFKHKRHH